MPIPTTSTRADDARARICAHLDTLQELLFTVDNGIDEVDCLLSRRDRITPDDHADFDRTVEAAAELLRRLQLVDAAMSELVTDP